MKNWTEIGKSSTYRILNMLEQNKLVISRNKVKQGRNLKIYSITPEGKQILKDYIYNTISKGRDFGRNFELALSNLPRLDKNEQIEAFEKGLKILMNTKEHLMERYNLAPIQEKIHVKLIFTRSSMMLDAEINFMEIALQELKKE